MQKSPFHLLNYNLMLITRRSIGNSIPLNLCSIIFFYFPPAELNAEPELWTV